MRELLAEIRDAIVRGEDDRAAELTRKALKAAIEPEVVLELAIIEAIKTAGKLWDESEFYFVPDVIQAAQAFRAAVDVCSPALKRRRAPGGRIVIATVEGDVHDLGKGIVAAFLTGAGFEVHDLGVDVPAGTIVEKVRELRPDVLGLGAYMTTTMLEMEHVVRELKQAGLRDDIRVLIGGVPTSQKFCDQVGADAWGKDAADALAKAEALLSELNPRAPRRA